MKKLIEKNFGDHYGELRRKIYLTPSIEELFVLGIGMKKFDKHSD